jgi:hypothetical protein
VVTKKAFCFPGNGDDDSDAEDKDMDGKEEAGSVYSDTSEDDLDR